MLTCQWTNLDAQLDDHAAPLSCAEEASMTTCDPISGVVCLKHKCRCSQPLDRETGKPLNWDFVAGVRAVMVRPSWT